MVRRHKIVILKKKESGQSEDGILMEEWIPIEKDPIWARVVDEGGKEFYAGAADYELSKIKINISFRTDVERKMLVLFNKKVYEIVRTYNGDYRNSSLNFDAERRSNQDGKIHC